MKKVIVGIGIPGSGKTTILKDFAGRNAYAYVCPDDIRAELTGNASDQSKNREVWENAYQKTAEYLKDGSTVVFDATFTHPEQRKEFLTFVREQGAEKVQGIFVDVGLKIAKERNKDRERHVPEYVLERMDSSLENFPPELTDGFDSIFTVDSEHKLTEVTHNYKENTLHREFSKFI